MIKAIGIYKIGRSNREVKQGGREGLKPIKPESYREAVSYILPEQQPEVSLYLLHISYG